MAKRDKPPSPIVRKTEAGLSPVSAYDAETLDIYALGSEFDLVLRSRRSPPHNGMYWAQLGAIVKATEAFPTAEHMHRWVKYGLGYVTHIIHPQTGEVLAVTLDSTSFAEMDQAEFNAFYEKACKLVAEEMGIDMLAVGREANPA